MSRLPEGNALCHLDFHPDQVIMTAHGPRIIDWMSACDGPPLADVARTLLLLRVGQVPYGGVAMRALATVCRRRFRRTYIRRYSELNPTASLREVELWMIPLAAARLREGISGEERPLLRFVARGLRARRRA
jgi:aminoglycoside phosphotransferase (APT) family kinase protein